VDTGYVSAVSVLAGGNRSARVIGRDLADTARAHTDNSTVQDQARREALYSEFVQEASKLVADAFEHELDDPVKFVQPYAIIISKIRLFGNQLARV
jgi:hypothetical protein